MTRLADLVTKVRSKNAGPFWLTIDVFCGTPEVLRRVSAALTRETAAALLQTDPATLKRYEIPELNVLKLSLPRPEVQGTPGDRDMHGASYANLLAEMDI